MAERPGRWGLREILTIGVGDSQGMPSPATAQPSIATSSGARRRRPWRDPLGILGHIGGPPLVALPLGAADPP